MAYLTGECLCGKIRYEYQGATGNLVHCHCSRCRKWHGAAFRSRIVVKRDGYKLLQGQEYLAQYQATPNVIKTFCKNCGSSLATIYPLRDNLLGLPIAGCEGDLDNYTEFHIYTDSKAQWWEITDSLPQFEPPSRDTRDSLLDSYLGFRPRQNAMTGLFHHGRTDRTVVTSCRTKFGRRDLSLMSRSPTSLHNSVSGGRGLKTKFIGLLILF